MAIVGKPSPMNPPKLFEVNEIGFDGLGRSSFIQKTILKIIPGLKDRLFCLDTAASEARNMRRLGRNMVRFQYNCYNWEEEVILRTAKRYGLNLRLSSPSVFDIDIDDECEGLPQEPIRFKNGKIFVGRDKRPPNAVQMAYSFELSDYKEVPKFFRNIIRSKTPQYSPFLTGLIAPKTILTLISDPALTKRLVGHSAARRLKSAILPAYLLDEHIDEVKTGAKDLVIKHADGMGGELTYIGNKIRPALKRIRKKDRAYWTVQERVHMNTMRVDGILSRPRRVIADLGVYINYDWDGRKFTNLNVAGFITRATNRSHKVNVSGGGIQVPVMFDRSK